MKPSRFSCVTLLGLSGAALAGCASERTEAKDPSYETLKSEEIESERQEFIQEKREEISEVGAKIESLQTKIEEESSSVDEHQRAEWRNVLFELEQERSHLKAELDRAQNVNEEEWKVMRGDIPVAVDSLQAGVTKLGNDVTNLFASEPTKVSADSGLCPMQVRDIDADVATKSENVQVELTTSEEADVKELRQRATSLAKMKAYQPGRLLQNQSSQNSGSSDVSNSRGSAANGQRGSASSDPGDLDAKPSSGTQAQRGSAASSSTDGGRSGLASSAGSRASGSAMNNGSGDAQNAANSEPIPVRRVSLQNIEDGVRVTFAVAADQRDRLSEQISKDAERLEAGDCEGRSDQTSSSGSASSSGASGSQASGSSSGPSTGSSTRSGSPSGSNTGSSGSGSSGTGGAKPPLQ